MTITFYKYTGENNRLDKSSLLTDGYTISGDFNIQFYQITPIIKITQSDYFDYNYCYIEELKRYYFIVQNVITRNGFNEIRMTLDVLMTYKNIIKTLHGTVVNSKKFNYLKNNNIPVTSKTTLKEYDFTDAFNHTGNYVLIGIGNEVNEN